MGIGNVLRHEYHRVSDRLIWNVVQEYLPPLKAAVLAVAADLERTVVNGSVGHGIKRKFGVAKNADWIVDMGPEGGDAGGEVVAQGDARADRPHAREYTGQYLKPVLARKGKRRGGAPRNEGESAEKCFT